MLIADADRITSRRAVTVSRRSPRTISTPTRAAVGNRHPLGEAAHHGDVAPAERRAQVGVGRRPAPALPDSLLHRAEAFLLGAVVVGRLLEPGLRARFHEGVVERIGPRPARHVQRPVGAAPVRSLGAVPVLLALEVGHHVGPAPAVGAHLGPGVKVARVAAHVDHAVDRRRAAQHLAARHGQPAAAEVRLGLGAVAPVVACHVHRIAERRRHLDERPPVAAAVFQHQHRVARLAQPVGEGRSGGAGAHDDEIRLHSGVPGPQRLVGDHHMLGERRPVAEPGIVALEHRAVPPFDRQGEPAVEQVPDADVGGGEVRA